MKIDLRQISSEKNIPYSDVLWQYVTEDFLWRIDKAGLASVLWQRKSEYATGEKLSVYYVYGKAHEAADKSFGVPVELIRGIITGNAECNSHSDVMWESETLREESQDAYTLSFSAEFDGTRVPFAVRIERLNEADAGIPLQREIKAMNRLHKTIETNVYSPESILAEQLFEIMDKLELVRDMKLFADSYGILREYSVSGRRIIDFFKAKSQEKPKVASMRRLEQLGGYRSYTYMKKRWNQYCKRQEKLSGHYDSTGWEETLDLILDFLTPVWSAFCNDEIFYDDWMPELGRFLG
ncbi:MAG: hypothetical protein U0K78_01030 [Agathobacter sp.]|uniref:hypothetical protein n=1 Tax=Agathobacter sp. TaxID=2021311 RepID=UPI002E797730|nr:hypothetical protein [Agathobacter sp.]MEE1216087.1 hypothetical protein [Agathobacter sp.]